MGPQYFIKKDNLFWVGGGWTNTPRAAFVFSRPDGVAKTVADLLGGRVVEKL